MVADPDPDGADLFQIAVGFLEQVTHQFIQTTLDCYLGTEGAACIGTWGVWESNTASYGLPLFLQAGSWSGAQEDRGCLGVSVEVGELDRACALAC